MPPRRRLPFVAAATATLFLLACSTDAAWLGKKRRPMSLAASFLAPHNAARRVVGLRPLKWDRRLAAYARRYAAARSGDCALVHSHGPFGENLFRANGSGSAWVRERDMYDARSNTCRGVCGRRTTAVGCALVPCGGGRGTFGICSIRQQALVPE
jgi:pathogenesis-related protein 1